MGRISLPDKARYDPADMAARGRIGGLVKASRYDADELTAAARRGFTRRFEDEVDPERSLPPAERARRAEAARRAFMARIARKRWAARRVITEVRE